MLGIHELFAWSKMVSKSLLIVLATHEWILYQFRDGKFKDISEAIEYLKYSSIVRQIN